MYARYGRKPQTPERQTLHPLLTELELLRNQEGDYQQGNALYFATDELDNLLAQGYWWYPHPNYAIAKNQATASDWYQFFRACGVRKYASPEDLIKSIEQITANNRTDETVKAVQTIYNYLNEDDKRKNHYGNSEVFRPLAAIAWLPAHNTQQWHKPAYLYQASFNDIIGVQAPVMRFGDTVKHCATSGTCPTHLQSNWLSPPA